MVIKEQGLLRAMKEAYKGTGYEIACKETANGPEIYLKTGLWWAMCEMKNLPRKVLGLLAEHMGDRVIHIRGTISAVSIAPVLPANEAERRVLEYLEEINA